MRQKVTSAFDAEIHHDLKVLNFKEGQCSGKFDPNQFIICTSG